MKLIVLAIILTAFVHAAPAAAQSVVITPKKITYKRPEPIQDFKRTFTITYPKVKASSPTLSKKIETTLSYAKVLKLDLKEELGEYQWLEEADYEVGYNKNGLLTITLSMNGTAAYPDGTSKTLVVDLKTGNQLKPMDVFTNLSGLTAMVEKAQEAEIKKASKEIKDDPANGDVDPAQLFEGKNFTANDLNEFAVDDKGVTFIYDYSFAHVIQALEPEGRYSFTWAQIKPHIKRNGLLAKFLR